MDALTFKPATRSGIKPLIGLFGKSGSGKTLTSLLLARGFVGPTGKIGIADSENGRGSYFVDMVPAGYEHLAFGPPFSPDRYGEVLTAAEGFGLDALVIDSMTHEWTGEGGYLDIKEAALQRMAGDDWKKREKCGMAAAAQCKPRHNKLIQRLLRSPIKCIILCFRAKDSVKPVKDESGKTVIERSEFVNPIQESELIFEMLISAEVCRVEDKRGCLRIEASDPNTKETIHGVLACLPAHGEQLAIEHGARLAAFCAANSEPLPPAKSKAEKYRDKIREMLKPEEPQGWLMARGIIDSEDFETLPEDRLATIGKTVKATLDAEGAK